MTKIIRKRNKLGQFTKISPWTEKFSRFAPIALVLIIGVMFLNVPITNAYFSDTATISGNTFSAGTLDVNISGFNVSDAVLPGNSTSTTITLSKSNLANLDYQYIASTTIIDTDQTACDYITISASSPSQNYFSMPLKNFISTASTPTDPAQWDFTFAVADGAPTGTCNFKISYTAWQTNLPDGLQGFSDVAEMTGLITIGQVAPPVASGVVLNEFLPRPDGDEYGFNFGNDSSDMPQGEWVELYNNGSADVDLTGWYLADATPGNGNETPINAAHILVPSPIIPAHGWLVVYMNKATYNNTGDTVRLFNASGTLVDSYSYGVDPTFCDMEPTPNDNNDTSKSGNCDDSNVPGNKSFARIPDGTGAWVDPIPTPGMPNMVEESVVETPAIANEVLSGGSSSGGASDVVQNMEVANSTPPVIEPQPSPEATAGEDEPAVETPVIEPVIESPATEPEPAIVEPITEPDSTSPPQAEPAIIELAPVVETPAPAEPAI